MAILTLCLCLMLCYISLYAAHPFVLAFRMRAENDEQERIIKRLQIENQDAVLKIRAFSDPNGKILILRQHDFILRDEMQLAIPTTQNRKSPL